MDLAKYCVDAMLIEGRSVRGVAAATGAIEVLLLTFYAFPAEHWMHLKATNPIACCPPLDGLRDCDT